MGALHEGHLSLIESSRKDNSITVCSIFVNPPSLMTPKDFEKYPVTIDKDILILERAHCDILFLPPVLARVYPDGMPGDERIMTWVISKPFLKENTAPAISRAFAK